MKFRMQSTGKKRRLVSKEEDAACLGAPSEALPTRFRSMVTQQGVWGYNPGGAEGERSLFSGSQCHFILYLMDEHEEA